MKAKDFKKFGTSFYMFKQNPFYEEKKYKIHKRGD